jgi:hypothetical protein
VAIGLFWDGLALAVTKVERAQILLSMEAAEETIMAGIINVVAAYL